MTVTRIDRLARSTFDLFAIVKQIVDAKGQFRSLAEPWADTSTSTGRLMIAVLGGLADVERDLIRTRTPRGAAARRRVASIWGGPQPSLRSNRQRHGDAVPKVRHSPSWRSATMSAGRRFRGWGPERPKMLIFVSPAVSAKVVGGRMWNDGAAHRSVPLQQGRVPRRWSRTRASGFDGTAVVNAG